jgi:hypothetical protein
MLAFTIDDSAVQDYLVQTRERILSAVRESMFEAMEGLANVVVGHTGGDPIVSRSGEFVQAVLESPKVQENDRYIKGSVSSWVGGKPMGVWFDEGTTVPAVAGTAYHFTAADGKSVFTHGHAAFQVAPHPIMNVSLEEYKPTILDIIQARVEGAMA